MNSWEHRIFKNSKIENANVILPSHWAGVFSGLYNSNVWYRINKSQLLGYEFDEIEIFPTDKTEELSSLVFELSSPIIPVFRRNSCSSNDGKAQ